MDVDAAPSSNSPPSQSESETVKLFATSVSPTDANNAPIRHPPPELSALIYCTIVFCLGVNIGSFGPAMLALQTQVQAPTLAAVAYGISVRTVAGLLSSFAGPLYDRFPGHVLLSGGIVIGGVGTACLSFATSVSQLYACMAALGIAAGFADNGANIMMIWAFAATPQLQRRGQTWLQALHFAFAAGATLGPLLQGALIRGGQGHATLTFALAGAASVACGLLLCVLRSPAHPETGAKIAKSDCRAKSARDGAFWQGEAGNADMATPAEETAEENLPDVESAPLVAPQLTGYPSIDVAALAATAPPLLQRHDPPPSIGPTTVDPGTEGAVSIEPACPLQVPPVSNSGETDVRPPKSEQNAASDGMSVAAHTWVVVAAGAAIFLL